MSSELMLLPTFGKFQCNLTPYTVHMPCSLALLACCFQVVPDWSGKPRSDLDMMITVYDTTGQPMMSMNPSGVSSTNGLGVAATNVTLTSAGWYYVSVAGTGSGDPTVTGYSDYGCLGQYTLTVALTPPPPTDPPVWMPPNST
jgi:hypothetical protein